jgi:predicted DNA-binding WGR domain protein
VPYLQTETPYTFWTIERVGTSCVTTNGRVGASPRETRKEFPDIETARRDVDRQITATLAKGYVEGSLANIPTHMVTDWSTLHLSHDVFWQVIALFGRSRGRPIKGSESLIALHHRSFQGLGSRGQSP